jgi:hypothetical protein
MTRAEVEGAGYGYDDLSARLEQYSPARLRPGWNQVDGEEIYFVANPALGLWGTAERFGA